ncbi:hypothetical protein PIB30_052586 [Stylosanthes scabra]|uniref:Phytocyanin domain-containing protein n=1 Tax=Stylosanthes scabra TaxID=79078 RepID=A0ABU6ZH15_9FABA|nr:hypothetical protein [Stylosanthes scabra]
MKGILGSSSPPMVLLFMAFAALVMLPEASAKLWIAGDNMGWTSNVSYSSWTKGKHFYNGDWLCKTQPLSLYCVNQMNVLEVNKKDYETCNSDHLLHNWTSGAGRDVVPLNVTGNHYFISGNGLCSRGMKLAIRVENPPPPPKDDNCEIGDAPALPPAIAEAPTLALPPGEIGAPTPAPPPAETEAPTLSPERGGAPTLTSRSQVLLMAVVFADAFIHFW